MAGKKTKSQWRSDVNTNEEWEEMLKEKQGLVVVEIFSTEYGPCKPMTEILKKLKTVDTDTNFLHIALAKSDEIDVLQRFRDKSEPVFMLIGNGKLVTILFGVSAPQILSKIKRELDNEMKVMRGEMKRPEQSFTAITKEEQMKAKRDEDAQKEMEAHKLIEQTERLEKYRLPALDRLKHLLKFRTIVIYFPSAILPSGQSSVMTKMAECCQEIGLTIDSLEDVLMTGEKIHKIFNSARVEMPNTLKELMLKKTCVVAVLKDKDKKFALGDIEYEVASIVYGKFDHDIIDCNKPRPNSIAAMYSIRPVKTRQSTPLVPVIWTPIDEIQKSAAMDALFPYKLEDEFKYISPELPPLQVIIIFEAIYGREVEVVIEENSPVVYRFGYFTSPFPEDAQLICKDWKTLMRLGDGKMQKSKLVIGIKDWSDNVLLEFFVADPFSLNTDPLEGSKQADLFFPYNFDEIKGEGALQAKNKK